MELHSAEAEALEGDEGAAGIEAEEGLSLDDGVLPEPASPHHTQPQQAADPVKKGNRTQLLGRCQHHLT